MLCVLCYLAISKRGWQLHALGLTAVVIAPTMIYAADSGVHSVRTSHICSTQSPFAGLSAARAS